MRSFFSIYYLIVIVFLGTIAFYAWSSSPFDIEFPIPELGNCADKSSCKSFCDDFNNKDACLEFAKKHNLIDSASAEKAKKLPPAGPGGCRGEGECRKYCDDPAHGEECLKFAEDHGLIDKSEIKKAREFMGQTGPGGCRGANECRKYCEDPSHKKECLDFARRKGLISDREMQVARKVIDEGGPGECRGEEECRAYCENPDHLEECLSFAEKQGLIDKEEAKRVRKTGGVGPGGCRGPDQCRMYCEEPSHQNECIDFAEKNGFMTKSEVERARKFVGKTGPGGCRGEQCREFCDNPDNAEVCLEHAEKEGLIPKEEIERAKKFLRAAKEGGPGGCRGSQCRDYCEDPAHRDECFQFAKKQGVIRPEEQKQFEAGRKIEQTVKEKGGPGGCRSDDECRKYCADPSHTEECIAFAATHGGIPQDQARQMLKDFTEERFERGGEFRPPEDFKRFEEESRRRFEEFRQLEQNFRGPGMGGFGGPGFPPGGPGGFPPGPDGRPGQGFVGPGGCTSPDECIKYCTEHKEECFQFGPPPGGGQPGSPFGNGIPEFRREAVQKISGDVFGEVEKCVAEAFGGFEQKENAFRSNAGDFFQKKEGIIRGCTERLKNTFQRKESKEGEEGFHMEEFDKFREFEKFRPPMGEDKFRRPGPCPALPTVSECPAGQRKEQTFSSPECGTYYVCIPEGQEFKPPFGGGFQGGAGGFQGRQGEFHDKPGEFSGKPGEFPGNFPQGFQGKPGEFQNRPPREFPGRPGEFPGRPGEFQGGTSIPFKQEGFKPMEDRFIRPPDGFRSFDGQKFPAGEQRQPFEGIGPVQGTTGIFEHLTKPEGEIRVFPSGGESVPPPPQSPSPQSTLSQ